MAATKRRLLNREKLSDIQSVDNLEKLLEQEIESIPQVSTALIDKDFQEKIKHFLSFSKRFKLCHFGSTGYLKIPTNNLNSKDEHNFRKKNLQTK